MVRRMILRRESLAIFFPFPYRSISRCNRSFGFNHIKKKTNRYSNRSILRLVFFRLERNLKFKRKQPFAKQSRNNLIADQASKDDPSSCWHNSWWGQEMQEEGERKRECSRRSRHESVGAFSFRRRLFLDASLINIKQAACARGDSRRRNVAVFFYSGTLSRLLVPVPVPLLPLYPFPSSIYPTPLHPEATICRSLSMHRRYRQAGAVTGAASAGGHVGSRCWSDVNDASDDVVSPPPAPLLPPPPVERFARPPATAGGE